MHHHQNGISLREFGQVNLGLSALGFYAASTQYILFEMESRRIIYSRDVVFDDDDRKIRSTKDVIEIKAAEGDDLPTQQEQTPITVQIDQSDEVEEVDDLSDSEEEEDDLIDFFRANIP